MQSKLIAALSGIALASALVASPVSADKPAEPAHSGVVDRLDTIGGHVVGPVLTDVGGTTLPIVVVVGWDDAVTFCSDGPPVPNGVEQAVHAPSGNLTVLVHNSDIPVLVFDTSNATDEEDFFAKCKDEDIVPLATGTAKQRPIIHVNDVPIITVKTRGVVTDGNGQDWTMQSFLREEFGATGPQVLNEWATLKAL